MAGRAGLLLTAVVLENLKKRLGCVIIEQIYPILSCHVRGFEVGEDKSSSGRKTTFLICSGTLPSHFRRCRWFSTSLGSFEKNVLDGMNDEVHD
jgi:hypothetical protein